MARGTRRAVRQISIEYLTTGLRRTGKRDVPQASIVWEFLGE
jgi:hypothetical protein